MGERRVAGLQGVVGAVEKGPRQPARGAAVQPANVGHVLLEERVEETGRLIEVGRPGLEAVGLARRVPADRDGRRGEPGQRPPPRDPEPGVPVHHVAELRVEAADAGNGRDAERHRRAAKRVLHDQTGGPRPRSEDAIRRTETAPPDDRLGDGPALGVDHLGRARRQANPLVGFEGRRVCAEMPRTHHVVLMKDGDQRRPAQRDASVPVPRQAEPIRIDVDPGAVAGLDAGDRQGLIVGAVVRDHEVEGRPLLRQDATQRLGEVASTVVGRDGDGQSRHGSVLSHASPRSRDQSTEDLRVPFPDG